jgi:hypothetical protein
MNDDTFREAVRELNIFEMKVKFFKSNGFKEEWGCPN